MKKFSILSMTVQAQVQVQSRKLNVAKKQTGDLQPSCSQHSLVSTSTRLQLIAKGGVRNNETQIV